MKKRLFCALLALCMLLGSIAMAEPAAAPAAESSAVYTHNGRVTLIDGACTDARVDSFDVAAQVVDSVLSDLGGDENTRLEPWRTLTDAFGNQYYVFQQMYDNTTVLGGAVKVITDAEGGMIGLTSSIEDNPSDEAVAEGIDAEAAQQIVLDHALETRQQTLSVVEGLTDRMILPIALHVDIEDEESEGSRYVWVVYTDNPDSRVKRTVDLPYLAHYVTMTGEYLYSLPTIMPGDEAGESGFGASYVFEFMEPVNYTGFVDLSTGGEKEISIDVMRDKRTGMYYLGNLERRIVVADCWEFLYNDNRIVLDSSTDNLEWDQVGLLSLYNYCRAYDYYKEIGWIGGDGLGTPILILNDFCDENHLPVDNAAYVGGYLGWQMFLASQGNDLSQCLDVLAHEFTHCVTGSVMTYNAYQNDYGAINEAMSDIQGKTCEMLMEGRENVTWMLGDNSIEPVRSMDEPHKSQQPEFTWDVYYVPAARTPTELNDRGGVHTDSSLLNHLAWWMYEKGGMTFEEGRAFWFTVDCAMVPGTDYAQLAQLLPWALRAAGLEQYDTELRRALDATRLGVDDIPETFDEDRALLTLTLPENEIFDDEQWVMMVYSVNVDKLINVAMEIFGHIMIQDYSVLPQFVQDILNGDEALLEGGADLFSVLLDTVLGSGDASGNADGDGDVFSGLLDALLDDGDDAAAEENASDDDLVDDLMDVLFGGSDDAAAEENASDDDLVDGLIDMLFGGSDDAPEEEQPAEEEQPVEEEQPDGEAQPEDGELSMTEEQLDLLQRIEEELAEWMQNYLSDVFYSGNTNAGQDGHTMRMVTRPGHALPILMHGVFNSKTSTLEDTCIVIYVCGHWVDVLEIMQNVDTMGEDEELPPEVETFIDQVIAKIDNFESVDDILDMFFYRIKGGEQNALPTGELEAMQPARDVIPGDALGTSESNPRMSRPKLDVIEADEVDEAEEILDAAA